jgi:8-oxo-dGTP diphosphatase
MFGDLMAVKRPVLTVDVLIRKDDGYVFVKRKNEPYKGCWAIPGGLVEYGETLEQAAMREAKEETGLGVKLIRLVGVYSDLTRDPRGHYISIVYLAEAVSGKLKAATDAEEAKVFKGKPERLAFDHSKIFEDAIGGQASLHSAG